MRHLLLACLLLPAAPGSAKELMIKDMTVPQFDAAGHMFRRLRAEAATGSHEEPKLTKGVVEFFPATGAKEKTAALDFEEAVYHRATGIISGTGRIHLACPQGEISGVGFRYELSTGHLTLTSTVVMETSLARIEAGQGEAFHTQGAEGKEFSVTKAVLSGGVAATGIKNPKVPYERLESESGIYTAADGMVRLASPVVAWEKGQKTIMQAADISFFVGQPKAPASAPAAPATVPPQPAESAR